MVEVLLSDKERGTMERILSEVSNSGLERLLELTFQELKGRGVHYGLDGPYSAWDHKWGADAVGILEIRNSQGHYTIHPVPNPRPSPYEPPSAGATGPDPDQSKGV